MISKPLHNFPDDAALLDLAQNIKRWAQELGFQQTGIAGTDLGDHEERLNQWLAQGYQGEMEYMARHGRKRSRPAELVEGTLRVISLRMDYLPDATAQQTVLDDQEAAYISRYTLGRDYHKLIRKRLTQLVGRIEAQLPGHQFRVFTDSAPVLERALAQQAGLGWIGKNTMLINPKAGSYFFLAEIYTDLPLPVDAPFTKHHCGSCRACLDICPTQAFVEAGVLDARRCISYLTIELKGPIPHELRAGIGNRIYGCDDCLAVCPWNKFAQAAARHKAFLPRAELAAPRLAELLALDDAGFRKLFSGSPIKRIGRDRFVRNCLIAAGNSGNRALEAPVRALLADPDPVVAEAAGWALERITAAL